MVMFCAHGLSLTVPIEFGHCIGYLASYYGAAVLRNVEKADVCNTSSRLRYLSRETRAKYM